MAGNPVGVEGLAELRKALGQIGGPALQKNLRSRFLQVGQEVAADARSQMPEKTGRAKAAVKAGVSGNNAYVQTGSRTAAHGPWLDWGGVLKPVGGRHNTIRRPRIKGGRYLYPAIKRKRPRIEQAAEQALEQTGRDLGLK